MSNIFTNIFENKHLKTLFQDKKEAEQKRSASNFQTVATN